MLEVYFFELVELQKVVHFLSGLVELDGLGERLAVDLCEEVASI